MRAVDNTGKDRKSTFDHLRKSSPQQYPVKINKSLGRMVVGTKSEKRSSFPRDRSPHLYT